MCSSSNPELNCLCPQWWHIHPHSSTVILEYSQPKIALLFSSLEGKRVVNYNFVLITLITVKMCSSWWHCQEHKPLLCFSLTLWPFACKKKKTQTCYPPFPQIMGNKASALPWLSDTESALGWYAKMMWCLCLKPSVENLVTSSGFSQTVIQINVLVMCRTKSTSNSLTLKMYYATI